MAGKVHPKTSGDFPQAHHQTMSSRTDSSDSLLPPRSPERDGEPPFRHPSMTKSSSHRSSVSSFSASSAAPSEVKKPLAPPPGTYVIRLPKEQIFSLPPPENAKKYESFSRQKTRRSCCHLCLCYTLVLLLVLILAGAIAAGVLYFVFRPEAPKYTVNDISIRGMNITSTAAFSPEFDVSIRSENPNKKLGIYYRPGSIVEVSHNGVIVSDGVLPVFFQPSKNVTVFQTVLKGSNVILANGDLLEMRNQQKEGNVLFRLNVKAPVKIKVGAVKTWTITVKVKCDVTVNALNENSKIKSRSCDYSVRLW